MTTEFLTTAAQVTPILLLAVIYETGTLREPNRIKGIVLSVTIAVAVVGEFACLAALFSSGDNGPVPGMLALASCSWLMSYLITDILMKAYGIRRQES